MCSAPVHSDVHPEHRGGTGPPVPPQEVRPLLTGRRRGKRFWSQGEPFVWGTGAALAFTLALAVLLLGVVLWNGLGVFWPDPVAEVQYVVGVHDPDGTIAGGVQPRLEEVRDRLEAIQPQLDRLNQKIRRIEQRTQTRRARVRALRRDADLAAEGVEILGDGTVQLGDGNRVLYDGTVVLADGSRRLPDGSIQLVDGAELSPAGAIEVIVEDGGTLPLMAGRPVSLEHSIVTVPLLTGAEAPENVGDSLVTGRLEDGRLLTTLLGEQLEGDVNPDTGVYSLKFKKGNREDGPAFQWVEAKAIHEVGYPENAYVLDRTSNLNYFGYLDGVDAPGLEFADRGELPDRLAAAMEAAATKREEDVGPIEDEEKPLANELNNFVKYDLLKLRYRSKQLARRVEVLNYPLIEARWDVEWWRRQGVTLSDEQFELWRQTPATDELSRNQKLFAKALAEAQAVEEKAGDDEKQYAAAVLARYQRKRGDESASSGAAAPEALSGDRLALARLLADELLLKDRQRELTNRVDELSRRRNALEKDLRENVAVFLDALGRERRIALLDIIRFWCPNRMSFLDKVGHYAAKTWELVSAAPREANQDGGIFPAIFGTVLLVFLMAITCFPLGVLAGIYLGEYAKEGPLVRLVRIAVNNLAGIPSIVYGIFGLGFFIYLCGGALDRWLFPALVDAREPVFNKGCIIWASLTLGLLTIPVVIVSTEEALRQIPRGVREGSYALGATKFQTLCRVLIPMSSPGIMTGFILAMARAAGEVAPLMITGAVKDAPLPVSGNFPYVHLDRSFMHLGFHILDISCKSPNVEATKPLVYVTTLLLLLIVLTMTSLAIYLRNKMRKRYQSRAI